MHCYTHQDSHAIAVCRTCGKAVCGICSVSIPFAIACSTECADEAKAVHEMNQRGKKLYGIGGTKKRLPSGVVMWGLFAALFCGAGVINTISRGTPDWFLLCFGAVSVIVAVIAYRRAKETGLQC
ncbi:MAG: hypothetical protein QM639_07240 [Rhodocyclaceae bacterium]